jgi:hypothetical protein
MQVHIPRIAGRYNDFAFTNLSTKLDSGVGQRSRRRSEQDRAAGEAGGSGRYMHPLSGSRAIVCQTALPADASGVRPAVWITDDQRYAYAAFTP